MIGGFFISPLSNASLNWALLANKSTRVSRALMRSDVKLNLISSPATSRLFRALVSCTLAMAATSSDKKSNVVSTLLIAVVMVTYDTNAPTIAEPIKPVTISFELTTTPPN
jgi:hypothetical protein